jgi:Icc-related predicted phosphoesterase
MPLFRKRRFAEGPEVRLYYASDIHGSDVLWRKFLNAPAAYKAGVLVMGGDLTGKVVVPIVEGQDGFHVRLYGREEVVPTDALGELEQRIRGNGMYPHLMTGEQITAVAQLEESERERWFASVMQATLGDWLTLAAERLAPETRCYVMPGNDDPPGVDHAIERATRVEACDGRLVAFAGYTMISCGYSNRTPFDSPRELDEDELYQRVAVLAEQVDDMERCVFNLHVPPYDSSLDMAPALTDDLEVVMQGSAPKMIPVGSTAVRELIEHYQPMLGLHGHVHESPGATRIGRTLCINPGSDYHTGRISGCLLRLRGPTVRHQFLSG